MKLATLHHVSAGPDFGKNPFGQRAVQPNSRPEPRRPAGAFVVGSALAEIGALDELKNPSHVTASIADIGFACPQQGSHWLFAFHGARLAQPGVKLNESFQFRDHREAK
jgi:hypothetical protein